MTNTEWNDFYGYGDEDGVTKPRRVYNPDKIQEAGMLKEMSGGYNIIETVKPQGTRKYNKKSKYWETRWIKTTLP